MGSRHAFIACGVALFFLLQAFLSPLLAQASARDARSDGPAVTTILGKICHSDSGDPSGKAHHEHGGCCILCESDLRDVTLFVAVAWMAATLAPPVEMSFVVALERDDARPHTSGWASSWSSRAPPSFS